MTRLVPQSNAPIREYNQCHSPEDGKFCSGDVSLGQASRMGAVVDWLTRKHGADWLRQLKRLHSAGMLMAVADLVSRGLQEGAVQFREFNQCHSPEDGKFCSAPDGAAGGGSALEHGVEVEFSTGGSRVFKAANEKAAMDKAFEFGGADAKSITVIKNGERFNYNQRTGKLEPLGGEGSVRQPALVQPSGESTFAMVGRLLGEAGSGAFARYGRYSGMNPPKTGHVVRVVPVFDGGKRTDHVVVDYNGGSAAKRVEVFKHYANVLHAAGLRTRVAPLSRHPLKQKKLVLWVL